jgi:hypothetical protein
VRLLAPNAVTNDRVAAAHWTLSRQQMQRDGGQSPRIDLVFSFRQCDKKNQGWREGPPLFNALPRSDWRWAFTLRSNQFEQKKNIAFWPSAARLRSNANAGKGRPTLICLLEAEL